MLRTSKPKPLNLWCNLPETQMRWIRLASPFRHRVDFPGKARSAQQEAKPGLAPPSDHRAGSCDPQNQAGACACPAAQGLSTPRQAGVCAPTWPPRRIVRPCTAAKPSSVLRPHLATAQDLATSLGPQLATAQDLATAMPRTKQELAPRAAREPNRGTPRCDSEVQGLGIFVWLIWAEADFGPKILG